MIFRREGFMLHIFLSFLLIPLIVWSEVSDELKTVCYGGMTIECSKGCGDVTRGDPDMKAIAYLFRQAIDSVFSKCRILDDSLYVRTLDPWERRGNYYYAAWDWRSDDARWRSDGVPQFNIFSIRSYSDFQTTAQALQEDLRFYHFNAPQLNYNRLKDLFATLKKIDQTKYGHVKIYKGEVNLLDWGTYTGGMSDIDLSIMLLKSDIATARKQISQFATSYQGKRAILEKAIEEIDALFKDIFVWCLEHHQHEGVKFRSALEHFIAREFDEAFKQVQSLIDLAEEKDLGDDLISKLYLLQGQVHSEFSLHGEAIVALTKAIRKDPALKDAYFERAASYFELGNFDQAIADYLESGYQRSADPWELVSEMSSGIAIGIVEKGISATLEFLPEVLSSMRGLGNGLWAFSSNPIGASQSFVNAAKLCIEFIRSHSSFEVAQELVPELKELCTNYDVLNDFEKGKLIGQVIGQYGTDIFLCKYSMQAIKAFCELKKANQMMTLEALASSKSSGAIREEAGKFFAHREEVLKNANLKFHADRQGKHIEGHRNYEELVSRGNHPSIFQHPEPERLIRQYAGTGIRSKGNIPGMPDYVELVNFEEVIGYAVNEKTGDKTLTTWGKIHYAKEGLHIVPTLRKGNH